MPPKPKQSNSAERWHLRLYVAGKTPRCEAAEENLRKVCEEYLADRYSIEVVDLLEHPTLAQVDARAAVPLVRAMGG